MFVFIRLIVVIIFGIVLIGGLYLDGVMDVVDGLVVLEKKWRFEVMIDSVIGVFGVMVAIVLLFIKIIVLIDLDSDCFLILMGIVGWGRWG